MCSRLKEHEIIWIKGKWGGGRGSKQRNVRLVYFSLSVLVSLQQKFGMRVKGFKTTDMLQLNYSRSRQIKQTLPRHGSRTTPKDCHYNFSGSPLLYFHLFLLFVPCTVGLIPPQSGRVQIGICSRPIDSCKLYNNRLYRSYISHNSVFIIKCICV